MRTPHSKNLRVQALAIAAHALLWLSLSACHVSGQTECSCFPGTSMTITAPLGAVADVRTSGPACASASVSCLPDFRRDLTGCAGYDIMIPAGGACTVEVDFKSGAHLEKTVNMIAPPPDTCCAVASTENPADGTWVLSNPDAGIEAGTDAAEDGSLETSHAE